ncbi:restriction endonuclease subunit S [Bacteroides xylanisolvens]|uniref:restriction endonuclease subunit S n=1 Tax=Bacteroides xylanisolvens TaxID=371601 RepID=UPI001E385FBE|nr:restriction endonuclease subunit S [Bacteroides xylanisolvens]MCM1715459.1 restriction endonuclease subunit S [Bacteroides xylanisolvens]
MANNNNKDKCNVPNLRFPEFSGEWEMSSIGEQFELYSGNTPSRMNKNQFDGSINWITSGELKEHYISDTKEKISEEAAKNNSLKLLPVGTFVIAIYGLEANGVRGTCSITTRESTISQACMAFTSKMDIQNEFLYSWYKKHGNIIGIKYAQGTKQQNLSYDIIERFNISYPCMEEQKKLIRFISLIDQRIATQNKIIYKLKSLIRGIAQNMVHRGKPKVRLSDCMICNSSTLQESEVLESGTYPVYGANGIVGYLDCYATLNEAIYIIKDGSGVGTVFYVAGKCSAAGTLNTLQAKEGYSLQYLYYLLTVFNFEPYKTGMAIPHIYFKDYGKAKVFCPSHSEQFKYTKLLSTIDSKLLAEQNALVNYNLQKQYLLRQMFI